MMKKRLLALVLALAMMVSLMVVPVSAAEVVDSGTCGDNLTWVLDGDGTLTISGTGDMTDWSSSSTAPWYEYFSTNDYSRYSVKTVVIESGVTSIGDYAFYECRGLTNVTIPDGVTVIGSKSFCFCVSLESIDIPNSVTNIKNSAFWDCYKLTTLTLPSNVNIATYAFGSCFGLTSVTIGIDSDDSSEINIGDYAFFQCTSLNCVIMGIGIKNIEMYAFSDCADITDVYYVGSEDEWNNISISAGNKYLTDATIHYNSTGPDDDDDASEDEGNHITSLSPENGSVDVELGHYNDNIGLTIEITFDQEVELGTGNFYLCDYETGAVYRTMAADGGFLNYDNYVIWVSEDNKTVSISIINTVGYCLNVLGASNPKACVPYNTKLCIKMDSDAIILTESTDETCEISSRDTWAFTTEWGLTADQDLLQFLNNSDYFDCEHVEVSDLLRGILLYYALDSKSTMNKLEEYMDEKEWSGSCFGIDAVTALTYTGSLDLGKWALGENETSVTDITEVLAPKDSKWTFGSQDLVNFYQLVQIAIEKDTSAIKLGTKSEWKKTIDEIVALADDLSENKTESPFLLNITIKKYYDEELEANTSKAISHNVLVTGYRTEGDNKVLEVYDSTATTLYGEIIIDSDYNVTIDSSTWYVRNSDSTHSSAEINKISYCTLDEISDYNVDSLVEASTTSAEETDSGIQVASLSAKNEEYTTIYCSGSSDFTLTNAEGETFSYIDGEYSATMEVYSLSTIGEGTNFEYVIQTDSSTSFSLVSESDSEISLTVYQDDFYIDAYAEGAEKITIVSGISATIEGSNTVQYRTHFDPSNNDEGMIAILGISEGDATFTYTDDMEIQVDSGALTDTTVKYYDAAGDYTEMTVDDSEQGLVVEVTPSYDTPTVENPFTDVNTSHYFYNAVLWAVDNGITSGTTETTFSPFLTAERCQVVTFLWRAAGCPEPTSTENPFTDVNEGDYFYTAVLWAVEQGITTGTSATTFSPFAKCERCQVVTFLYRYFGQPEVTTTSNPFTDVDTDDYFYNAVLWAVDNGITTGTSDTTFGPFVTCERCMVVTFLYRALVE